MKKKCRFKYYIHQYSITAACLGWTEGGSVLVLWYSKCCADLLRGNSKQLFNLIKLLIRLLSKWHFQKREHLIRVWSCHMKHMYPLVGAFLQCTDAYLNQDWHVHSMNTCIFSAHVPHGSIWASKQCAFKHLQGWSEWRNAFSQVHSVR